MDLLHNSSAIIICEIKKLFFSDNFVFNARCLRFHKKFTNYSFLLNELEEKSFHNETKKQAHSMDRRLC